jgi:hypothetical protein
MSVFQRGEEQPARPEKPAQPAKQKDAPKSKKNSRRRSSRSTQVLYTTPKVTGPASVFISNPAQSVSYSTPRTLTAAAVQLKINDKGEFEQFRNRRSAASSAWQAEAWEYYDAIGEIKYAFNLVASVVSRIRIYAAVIDNPSDSPASVRDSSTIDPKLAAAAERALARLDSAYGGQAGLLRDAALNLSVAGECYLVQMPELRGTGLPESWDIRSIDEVTTDARGGYNVISRREQYGAQNAVGVKKLTNGAFVGRIWRSHPCLLYTSPSPRDV